MVLWQTWWAGIYRVEYSLGGNYIRRNFLDCNSPDRDFLGGNFPGGSYPGWEFSRWELSWVEIFRVGIVRVGVILGGNFLWWVFSGWGLSGGIIRMEIIGVGVFLIPIHLFLIPICWKFWSCSNFSVNWNQLLICWKCHFFCYYTVRLVDFMKSNSVIWIVECHFSNLKWTFEFFYLTLKTQMVSMIQA